MKDLAEVFSLGPEFFQARGQAMNKEDLEADLKPMNLQFSEYETCKFTFVAILGLRAPKDDFQK
jgi:hypothetical protein